MTHLPVVFAHPCWAMPRNLRSELQELPLRDCLEGSLFLPLAASLIALGKLSTFGKIGNREIPKLTEKKLSGEMMPTTGENVSSYLRSLWHKHPDLLSVLVYTKFLNMALYSIVPPRSAVKPGDQLQGDVNFVGFNHLLFDVFTGRPSLWDAVMKGMNFPTINNVLCRNEEKTIAVQNSTYEKFSQEWGIRYRPSGDDDKEKMLEPPPWTKHYDGWQRS